MAGVVQDGAIEIVLGHMSLRWYISCFVACSMVQLARPRATTRATLAGILGGLAGTLVMNYAQRLWTKAVDGEAPPSAGGKHDARDWQERDEGQNANELAAQAIATAIAGRRLTYDELTVAAPLAHYSFGAASGALYGGLIGEGDRKCSFRRGATFGAAVWLIADELAMPVLRLSRPTTERSLEKHLQSFFTHIVFGTVAEMVRARTSAAVWRGARPSVQPPLAARATQT